MYKHSNTGKFFNTEAKYSPKNLEDFVFPSHDVKRTVTAYASGEVTRPLILSGRNGTGKSLLARLIPKAIEKREDVVVSEIKERNSLGQKKTWNNANDYILSKESLEKDTLKDKLKEFDTQNQVWVTFKKYGNNEIIPFNGTITGISEDITPEWNNFKYLGSPFKSYRYLGVERTLNFELKLYYNKEDEKNVMIKKINYLKSLAFPYETPIPLAFDDWYLCVLEPSLPIPVTE